MTPFAKFIGTNTVTLWLFLLAALKRQRKSYFYRQNCRLTSLLLAWAENYWRFIIPFMGKNILCPNWFHIMGPPKEYSDIVATITAPRLILPKLKTCDRRPQLKENKWLVRFLSGQRSNLKEIRKGYVRMFRYHFPAENPIREWTCAESWSRDDATPSPRAKWSLPRTPKLFAYFKAQIAGGQQGWFRTYQCFTFVGVAGRDFCDPLRMLMGRRI